MTREENIAATQIFSMMARDSTETHWGKKLKRDLQLAQGLIGAGRTKLGEDRELQPPTTIAFRKHCSVSDFER